MPDPSWGAVVVGGVMRASTGPLSCDLLCVTQLILRLRRTYTYVAWTYVIWVDLRICGPRQLETNVLGSPVVPHCTACGAASQSFEERHLKCPDCGHIDWNNPVPAVGVAILRGEQILLAQRAREPKQGLWDLVGGFIEPGETGKEAIAREVAEETGLQLTSMELVDVLPGDYAGRPSINLLFIGQAQGEPDAQDDVAALEWFALDELPELAWPHEAQMLEQVRQMMEQVKSQMPS